MQPDKICKLQNSSGVKSKGLKGAWRCVLPASSVCAELVRIAQRGCYSKHAVRLESTYLSLRNIAAAGIPVGHDQKHAQQGYNAG